MTQFYCESRSWLCRMS